MMNQFAEEEGDQKVAAFRRRGPRGLGVSLHVYVGLGRLRGRLDDLDGLGCVPKASEWVSRVVLYTGERWVDVVLKSMEEGAARDECNSS